MNIKKAIGTGLLVFAVQFASVSVIGNTFGPLLGTSAWAGYAWQAAMVLLLVAIVYCTARWYFTGTIATAIKGFYLGIVVVAVSFVINLLQTIPAIALGQNISQPLLQYVSSISFWVTVVITVASATCAGFMGARRHSGACSVKGAVAACMPKEGTEEK